MTSARGTLAKNSSGDGKTSLRALLIGIVGKGNASHYNNIQNIKKRLRRHKKFRIQVDENDELACWANIYRKSYQDRFLDNVRDMVKEI